ARQVMTGQDFQRKRPSTRARTPQRTSKRAIATKRIHWKNGKAEPKGQTEPSATTAITPSMTQFNAHAIRARMKRPDTHERNESENGMIRMNQTTAIQHGMSTIK